MFEVVALAFVAGYLVGSVVLALTALALAPASLLAGSLQRCPCPACGLSIKERSNPCPHCKTPLLWQTTQNVR